MAQLTRFFAECAALAAQPESSGRGAAFADIIVRTCAALPEEQFRRLETSAGATPDDVAASLREAPFADRLPGNYLPIAWLESFCTTLELPLAEVNGGWTVSDGEATYFCPLVELADDPDSPADTRPYVLLDGIRAWPAP